MVAIGTGSQTWTELSEKSGRAPTFAPLSGSPLLQIICQIMWESEQNWDLGMCGFTTLWWSTYINNPTHIWFGSTILLTQIYWRGEKILIPLLDLDLEYAHITFGVSPSLPPSISHSPGPLMDKLARGSVWWLDAARWGCLLNSDEEICLRSGRKKKASSVPKSQGGRSARGGRRRERLPHVIHQCQTLCVVTGWHSGGDVSSHHHVTLGDELLPRPVLSRLHAFENRGEPPPPGRLHHPVCFAEVHTNPLCPRGVPVFMSARPNEVKN